MTVGQNFFYIDLFMNSVFVSAIGCKRYNPCQQRCVDDDNGVSCACNQGYTLQADGINCKGQSGHQWSF